MGHQIEVKSYAAIPAILAIAGAAFILKPEELRRHPILEVKGAVGLAQKYEVMYAACMDGSDAATADSAGVAKGFIGGYSHRFPARGDEDAAAFARRARPQCEIASLYRLDRRAAGSPRVNRYARTRVEI